MARKLFPVAIVLLALSAPALAGAADLSQSRVAPVRETPDRHVQHVLIAPLATCPGEDDAQAPAADQRRAMICMTEFARRDAGLRGLAEASELDRSAGRKSEDILRCDSFSHFACGREFTYWMRRSGYLGPPCWRAAENLAWGVGARSSVRSVFSSWMHSPDHRRNILGRFGQVGVDMQVGTLDGRPGTHVWTQHFGSHC